MTKGADIIAGIILVALAIAIIVYLLHWLYRRSSKEVSFVRTGMLGCLLYTSPSPRDRTRSRMPSSA